MLSNSWVKLCFDSIDLGIIYQSGQCFRWQPLDPQTYIVFDGDAAAVIRQENPQEVALLATFGGYRDWYDYFDGAHNYREISEALVREDSRLKVMIEKSRGLRLLKQDPLEILITFMMSANNHIPRIRNFVFDLSEAYGQVIGEWAGKTLYAFPKLDVLTQLSEGDFKTLGAGYRARYFKETLSLVAQTPTYADWSLLKDEDLLKALMGLMGVGRKVAECIMLFAYGRWSVFPVDTWIKQLAVEWLGLAQGTPEKIVRETFYEYYGPNRGLIQQYLFYYYRIHGGLS